MFVGSAIFRNDNHLGENVGQAGVVLFRDLVEHSKHSKTVRLDEVVVGWRTILVEVYIKKGFIFPLPFMGNSVRRIAMP